MGDRPLFTQKYLEKMETDDLQFLEIWLIHQQCRNRHYLAGAEDLVKAHPELRIATFTVWQIQELLREVESTLGLVRREMTIRHRRYDETRE